MFFKKSFLRLKILYKNSKERSQRRFDAVTCLNPNVIVHDAKFKVDGISKYLDNTQFRFDHTYVYAAA